MPANRYTQKTCKACRQPFSMDAMSVRFCYPCKMQIIRTAPTLQLAADRLGLSKPRVHQLAVAMDLRPHRRRVKRNDMAETPT